MINDTQTWCYIVLTEFSHLPEAWIWKSIENIRHWIWHHHLSGWFGWHQVLGDLKTKIKS